MIRLKELREMKGISQKELADFLNLTQVQISKYELGKNEPDLSTTKKIANYFNVTIDYLLGSSEEDIILITKEDLDNLKQASNTINNFIKKISPNNETNIFNARDIQIGDNNSNIAIGSNHNNYDKK